MKNPLCFPDSGTATVEPLWGCIRLYGLHSIGGFGLQIPGVSVDGFVIGLDCWRYWNGAVKARER
jgi:hypothetical protein